MIMGGNVLIDGVPAQRIDLTQFDRKSIVKSISRGIREINDNFLLKFGIPLWSDQLLSSCQYLSGSSFHLFNLNISDEEFVSVKKIIGDIDIQVDIQLKPNIKEFLSGIQKNTIMGSFRYIGFKTSPEQFISLWNLIEFDLNIQIDFELVSFSNGEPSSWSRFSHSCSWEDCRAGIKGVFQKYLMRAFQNRAAKDVVIVSKSRKEKIIHTSELAFSLQGLRVKLIPLTNNEGKQHTSNGLPLYRKVDTKDSIFITDLNVLFTSFFGVEGSEVEINLMESFMGLVFLSKKYMPQEDLKKVVEGFANLLWGLSAQKLVRNNLIEDFEIKMKAFDFILKKLGGNKEDYQVMIDIFYRDYKG